MRQGRDQRAAGSQRSREEMVRSAASGAGVEGEEEPRIAAA